MDRQLEIWRWLWRSGRPWSASEGAIVAGVRVAACLTQHRVFLTYCLIGAGSATLDFIVYSVLVGQTSVHYEVANAIGYAAGTVSSFLLNAHLNFKTTDKMALRFLAFGGVAVLGWLASAVVLYAMIDGMGWNKYVTKFCAIGVVVMVQYNLNRILAFRGHEERI
jgi:putative flippase GtrA